jgi:acyl-CoA synthetase (AMP-forming)/AMP-acid ligase II
VVAIFSHNCIDTPAVTWGCHWAGGIISPANPGYTVRELAHHLKDSGAKALFTQKALLGNAVKAAAEAGIPRERIVLIGEEHDGAFLHFSKILGGVEGVREKVDPDRDLAFLVYSSGTTGLPKGVMLSHLNVVSDMHMFHSREGASSLTVYPGFAGETIPPAQWHPHVTAGVSIQLCEKIASTSPFFHAHCFRRADPNCSVVRRRVEYV